MHAVPERVYPGHLVGEELDQQHQTRSAENPRVLQHAQALGQAHPVQVASQTDDEQGRVQANPGSPAKTGGNRQQTGQVKRP